MCVSSGNLCANPAMCRIETLLSENHQPVSSAVFEHSNLGSTKKGQNAALPQSEGFPLDLENNSPPYLCPPLAHKLGIEEVNKFKVFKDLLQKLCCQQCHWAFRAFHYFNFNSICGVNFSAVVASPPPLKLSICDLLHVSVTSSMNTYKAGFSFEIMFSLYHNQPFTVRTPVSWISGWKHLP